jgi:surface antigen
MGSFVPPRERFIMRSSSSLASLAAALAAALALGATLFFAVDGATATEPRSDGAACPCAVNKQGNKPWSPRTHADLKATLNARDEVAALEAVQWALTTAADGATFVWHRQHGRLSGFVQPTSSFKDASSRVCRHMVMMLSSGGYSRKAEGVACREPNGVWWLAG